jgi:hypothetical protein
MLVLSDPDVEESLLGGFDVISDHDTGVGPTPPCKGEAAQRCRLQSDEERKQRASRESHPE